MKVIKIGGGCLKGKKTIAGIIRLLADRAPGHIVVVSALNGITDFLIAGMQTALQDETRIAGIISRLKSRHTLVARHLIPAGKALQTYNRDFNKTLAELERLLYGLNFTREITPRIDDAITSFGESLAAQLLAAALRAAGVKAAYRLPQQIGLITDGKFGDATADLTRSARNFNEHLLPLLRKNQVMLIPGFFGISRQGDVTTFGRGGSDYSAAVVTAAGGAEVLEVWKDVDGYLSADPRFIPEARLIPELSYDEAAELAYFGAKILHPRTVEPLRRDRLEIVIKNTLNPDAIGSRIVPRQVETEPPVKSVAHTTDIGLLKVHASGVGARLGILGQVAQKLAGSGINIKSVVTSQTCISLILALDDLAPGRRALMTLKPRPFRRLEQVRGIALISIVGQGLAHRTGIAARCFAAVAGCGVNVEMIAFGPSPVALYFIVRQKELRQAVAAVHSDFFGAARCF